MLPINSVRILGCASSLHRRCQYNISQHGLVCISGVSLDDLTVESFDREGLVGRGNDSVSDVVAFPGHGDDHAVDSVWKIDVGFHTTFTLLTSGCQTFGLP